MGAEGMGEERVKRVTEGVCMWTELVPLVT